jgi:hypothetical protein
MSVAASSFGIVIGMAAEIFLLPSHSLLLAIGPAVNAFTENIDNWIAIASREPV